MDSSRDSGGVGADVVDNSTAGEVYALPASLAQERFLAFERRHPGNPVWNLAFRFRLQGALEPVLLERTFNAIVRRHEALRTTLRVIDGAPSQIIAATLTITIPVIDLRPLTRAARDAEVERLSLADARRGFDLAQGPLLRVSLLRLADDEHILLVTQHHAVADYWSIGLITDELGALYEALAAGRPAPLADPALQYGDYAIWQREQAPSAAVQSDLAFWQERLRGLPLLELPTTDPGRDRSSTDDAAIISQVLPTALTDALRALGNRHGATFFSTLLAALQVVLQQATGQLDFGIATQLAGRDREEIEKVVGPFINTVVLRADLAGDPSFAELLDRVRETTAQAIAHQGLRFEQLLKVLRPADYPDHDTLFRVNFICQRDQVKPLDFAGIKLTVIPSKSQGALYDLNVFLVLRDDGWRLSCEYRTDLFEASRIERLLDDYRVLLGRIAADTAWRLSDMARPASPPAAPPAHDPPPALIDQIAAGDASRGGPEVTVNDVSPGAAAELQATASEPAPSAEPEREAFVFPTSLAQRRFWFLEQLDPDNPAYNIAVRWRLVGRLDARVLERALNAIIERHEALRTTFAAPEGEPFQTVWPSATVELAIIDLRTGTAAEREANAEGLARLESRRPFDLTKAPLLRASLLRLDEAAHVLLISTHHIVADGVSMGLLADDLGTIYEALLKGATPALAELPIQYADYAIWHRELIERGLDSEARYWTRQLADSKATEVVSDKPRPARQTLHGEILGSELPRSLTAALKELGNRQGCTLFMTLLAAFKVLLYRYTGQADLTIGTQVAGRERAEFERVVGVFINSLVLRTDLSGDPRFDEVMRRVRDTVLQALAHQTMPFEQLVELLKIKRDASRNPLVQINFTSHAGFIQKRKFADVSLIDMPATMSGALYDLNFFVVERSDAWRLSCQYNTDLYEPVTIARMLRHFEAVLASVAANPEQLIHEIPLLDDSERQHVLVESNGAATAYPRDALIHGLFEAEAARRPEAVAIVCGDRRLSYRELNGKANQLAHYLRSIGCGPETLIPLCVERSPDAIVAMLAILKAGGAYVPLDPAFSAKRLEYVLADTQAPLLVTQETLVGRIPGGANRPIVRLDKDADRWTGASDANLGSDASATGLACVMYTAGAADEPKGVMIPHRAIVHLAKNMNEVAVDEAAVFLQLASLAVDAATFEIWAPLLNGARLAIMPLELPSLEDLGRTIRQYGVTTVCLPTGLFHLIVDERIEVLQPLRQLLVAGDALAAERVDRALQSVPDCLIVNAYGPTENTTFTCCYPVRRESRHAATVPIGKPIANTGVWLLDSHRQPVPVGARGEIYIGGDGLARGYLNRPELTAARFMPHPFATASDARLYKSGDLARYLPDGNVELLGKIDDSPQPLDGATVASAAASRAGAADAPADAVARGRTSRTKRLAAYLFPSRHQPEGAVASAAHPDGEGAARQGAPRDDLEVQLLSVWEEVIGVHPIGLTDNFFDLGGHSMMALRLFARIKQIWGTSVPLATLLQAPTVEQLAEVLRQDGVTAPRSTLVPIQTGGSLPPLYIVSGVGGNVVRFYNFVRYLGREQPAYALQPPGLNGEAPFLTSVEELAARYVSEIKKVQPEGPYFLVGYSFGGIVTFEMARQLTAQRDVVGLVALLDAPEWSYLYRRARALKVRDKLSRYRDIVRTILFERERFAYLGDRLRRRATSLLYSLCKLLGCQLPQRLGTIQDVNFFAAAQYVPKPYAGCVTVFKTRTLVDTAVDDDTLGWGPFALDGVEVHEIPGEHGDITSMPNVRILAQMVAACLVQAHRGASHRNGLSHPDARFASDRSPRNQCDPPLGRLDASATIKG